MTRRGVATLWALVILTAVSVMSVSITRHLIIARRSLEVRQARAQAEQLADAGKLLALAKLKSSTDYAGETLALLPDSEVVIVVKKLDDKYQVVVESRMIANRHQSAGLRIEFTARRVGDRVEIVK